VDDRRAVAVLTQAVVGEIQRRIGKEASAGQAIEVDRDPRSHLAADAAELPHRAPELIRAGYTGSIQLREGLPARQARQVRARDPLV